jgi:hypothetical protein
MKQLTGPVLAILLACGPTSMAADERAIEMWSVDPLVKVFRDALPDVGGQAVAEVARGEHATLQMVVRSASPLKDLQADCSPLKPDGTAGPALRPSSVRFVGYVPVDRPIQTPPKDQLRKPPAEFPDPLLETPSLNVDGASAQPVWITVPIPSTASPGLYRGEARVTAKAGDRVVTAALPVSVKVFKASVGKSRLWVTNWFGMHATHMKVQPEADSPAWWQLLRKYARNMAEHRQNTALIPPLSLAAYKAGPDGRLEINFDRFDRWVQIFTEEGVIGRIEGGHVGGRSGGWESQFVVQIRQVKDGKVQEASADPAGPEADRFFAQFLPALTGHLQAKGWLDRYVQHLGDEPTVGNSGSYRAMAALVRKYAPKLRVIEACHTKDLVGAIDVWVPMLDFWHKDYEHYRQRQQAGEEVWFYTCVFPQGEYANRFIEQPLIKTRILHWINFRYGATGYLHWGYNWWTQDDPFKKTTREHPGPPYLPAGDPWIVYPGKDGPLDSIRWEAMRDGIADYELLSMLAERNAEKARGLAAKHVLDFNRYDCDVQAFRATRRELLELLSRQ